MKIIKSQKENLIKSLKKDIEALEIQISESRKNEVISYNENKLTIKKNHTLIYHYLKKLRLGQ